VQGPLGKEIEMLPKTATYVFSKRACAHKHVHDDGNTRTVGIVDARKHS